jgi:hypothetical protein
MAAAASRPSAGVRFPPWMEDARDSPAAPPPRELVRTRASASPEASPAPTAVRETAASSATAGAEPAHALAPSRCVRSDCAYAGAAETTWSCDDCGGEICDDCEAAVHCLRPSGLHIRRSLPKRSVALAAPERAPKAEDTATRVVRRATLARALRRCRGEIGGMRPRCNIRRAGVVESSCAKGGRKGDARGKESASEAYAGRCDVAGGIGDIQGRCKEGRDGAVALRGVWRVEPQRRLGVPRMRRARCRRARLVH